MSHPPQGQPPPQGHPPDGYGGPPREDPKAKRLVNLSTALGWGGIAMLILVGPIIGIGVKSMAVGGALSGLGLLMAIAGAIVGQIGRAMQGRVI